MHHWWKLWTWKEETVTPEPTPLSLTILQECLIGVGASHHVDHHAVLHVLVQRDEGRGPAWARGGAWRSTGRGHRGCNQAECGRTDDPTDGIHRTQARIREHLSHTSPSITHSVSTSQQQGITGYHNMCSLSLSLTGVFQCNIRINRLHAFGTQEVFFHWRFYHFRMNFPQLSHKYPLSCDH